MTQSFLKKLSQMWVNRGFWFMINARATRFGIKIPKYLGSFKDTLVQHLESHEPKSILH